MKRGRTSVPSTKSKTGLRRSRAPDLLPLPGTPGRGRGRGVSNVRLQGARLADERFSPLSPALSPEYRGEGANASSRLYSILPPEKLLRRISRLPESPPTMPAIEDVQP